MASTAMPPRDDDPSGSHPTSPRKPAPIAPLDGEETHIAFRALVDLKEEYQRFADRMDPRLEAIERFMAAMTQDAKRRNAFWLSLGESMRDKPIQWSVAFSILVITVSGVAAGQLPLVVQLIQNVTR